MTLTRFSSERERGLLFFRINRFVLHAGFSESLPAFGAFIAAPAMQAPAGRQAGETQPERKTPPRANDRLLLQSSERRRHLDVPCQRVRQRFLPRLKESGRRIGKRVASERGQGQNGDPLEGAEDRRFHRQKQVAPRQKNRLIAGARAGDRLMAHAPMPPVDILHGQRKYLQALNPGILQRRQEPAQPIELDGLPAQALAHINRRQFPAALPHLGQEHVTVKPPAHEHGRPKIPSHSEIIVIMNACSRSRKKFISAMGTGCSTMTENAATSMDTTEKRRSSSAQTGWMTKE